MRTKTPITSNFIKLETINKNYICSTHGWPKEQVCERYGFSANGKWIQLDIPQEIMKKLELELGKEIIYPAYISPVVLEREVDEVGGIDLKNEKEIFIQKPFQKDQSTQTEPDASEINKIKLLSTEKKKLLAQIKELEKEDKLNQQTILDLQSEVADLEEKLDKGKELSQQLQNEINHLNNTLQTTQQERDRIQQSLKRSLLGSLFKDKQKRERINELNNSLKFLRGLLRDKNQQVNNLTAERNNLRNQINNLNRQLTEANNEIANVKAERDNRPNNITLERWNNDYSKRPTQEQLTNLQTELDNTKRERDECRNRVCYGCRFCPYDDCL